MQQCCFIAIGTHANDRGIGKVGKIGVVAKGLPSVHVGQMHFNEGDRHRSQCITQRHAGMGIRGRIDDDERGVLGTGGLNAVDQCPLMIALEMRQLHPVLAGDIGQSMVNVGQRCVAVHIGLPGAQQIEVGPVYEQQAVFGGRCVQDRANSMHFAGF